MGAASAVKEAAAAAAAAKVTTKADALTNGLDKSQQGTESQATAQNATGAAEAAESRVLLKLVGDSILAIKAALNYSSGQRRYIEREMNLLNDANTLWETARSELSGLDGEVKPVATAPANEPVTADEKNNYAQGKIAEAVMASSDLVRGLPTEGISEQFRNSSTSFQQKLEKVQARFARVLKQRAAEKKTAELKQANSTTGKAVLDLDKGVPVLDLDKGVQPAVKVGVLDLDKAPATGAKVSTTAAIQAAFTLHKDAKPGFHPVALPSVTSSPHKAAYGVLSRLFATEMQMQDHAAASADMSARMAAFFSP